jgi:hypothetical protein
MGMRTVALTGVFTAMCWGGAGAQYDGIADCERFCHDPL